MIFFSFVLSKVTNISENWFSNPFITKVQTCLEDENQDMIKMAEFKNHDDEKNLKFFHGIGMFLQFGILYPIAGLIARYWKTTKYYIMIHQIVVMGGFCTTILMVLPIVSGNQKIDFLSSETLFFFSRNFVLRLLYVTTNCCFDRFLPPPPDPL